MEVFVFGSNQQGFHGAGAAGYAMRGDSKNNWCSDKKFLAAMQAPVGSPLRKGKLAVFGVARGVDTIVIGSITGIREDKNFGKVVNQRFHRLPYKKAVDQIKYKAAFLGIKVKCDIKENYTSQTCCACKDSPSKENAVKSNRRHRGLYVCKDCGTAINADVNGAANIAKKYLETESIQRPVVVLGMPVVYRFNGLKFAA